ncbi:MobA/MobL family protein (plasmid) [Streptococcus didelphis]|uniref:MobA/MobL family protein n=1 Tax=Streptococcus didelphis TaxID=102886 RepID=A0ABY9LJ49_9STRE|nr:hypothetical protein [Streptococcus didelphis]WMB28874.1 MobA/MobL family protein [Streptococcus didelphis]
MKRKRGDTIGNLPFIYDNSKREGGKSLIAMASYRSGEKLYSELYEKTNLYNHRNVKPEAFILKPDYAR